MARAPDLGRPHCPHKGAALARIRAHRELPNDQAKGDSARSSLGSPAPAGRTPQGYARTLFMDTVFPRAPHFPSEPRHLLVFSIVFLTPCTMTQDLAHVKVYAQVLRPRLQPHRLAVLRPSSAPSAASRPPRRPAYSQMEATALIWGPPPRCLSASRWPSPSCGTSSSTSWTSYSLAARRRPLCSRRRRPPHARVRERSGRARRLACLPPRRDSRSLRLGRHPRPGVVGGRVALGRVPLLQRGVDARARTLARWQLQRSLSLVAWPLRAPPGHRLLPTSALLRSGFPLPSVLRRCGPWTSLGAQPCTCPDARPDARDRSLVGPPPSSLSSLPSRPSPRRLCLGPRSPRQSRSPVRHPQPCARKLDTLPPSTAHTQLSRWPRLTVFSSASSLTWASAAAP